MLRSRVRSAQMLRLYAPRECLCGGAVGCSPHHRHGAMMEARRFSFKYAQKQQMPEMSQPSYIHDKRYGLFNNERNIGKSRRAASKITPLYQKHMNLWETDTDASSNRFFRSYVFGQRELHQLLGRPHGFEADEAGGKQGSSDYETRTDMRYKGIDRPAFINGHYEPEWQRTLYRNNAHGNQLSNPYSPLTAEVLGPELLQIRDAKTVHHAKAWFDRLHYLIRRHYDAVGNIGDYTSRNTQLVHQFFVAFHDALTNFDFQDAYLVEQLAAVRPKELEDLFGIFMEMEANYIHEDFCPRCSLPLASTQFCGEGEAQTPFRKHRGRWAPHQQWGKEWYDVVARRAEALWYRSTEDPFFGTPTHTQRQAEALLKVYVKAQQRARAIDFMHALRGSTEFALGKIVITEVMQSSLNTLLDTTPHQHLLTNSFQATSTPMAQAAGAAGAKKVPHSPVQMRIDLEMDKLRRQQREEGVVRVPPASWKLDTSGIVPYQLDAQQRITNWRAVKQSIEDSFMSSGLPKEAYTSLEWRGMIYWKWHLAQRGSARAGYEESLQQEQRAAQKGGSSSSSVVFPDRHWYRCFNTNPDVLKRQFGVGPSGTVFTVVTQTFPDPAAVVYNDPKGGVELKFDTTADACHIYADLESGDVLKLPASDDGATVEVVVVGVATHGPEQEWALYAMHTNPALHASEGLVELGKDAVEVSERVGPHAHTGRKADVAILDAQRTAREEFLGQIVGERGGMLYVQWRLAPGSGGDRHSYNGRGVATPLGTPEMVRQRWGQLKEQPKTEALVEPPSWLTPFRNDFAEERLKELEKGPFQRERWASLIPGKYTPKVKKFGYVQHTTQDDFMTKEYMDRLLSRQYFHNPQAFEVLPERRQKSVSFRGKWEYQRVAGLPTVDRHELENGWAPTEPISDEEVQVVEQAIKDISGRRPGNFIKSPTETQSLQLNESWWTPNAFGWAEANRAERAFVDSTEQKLTDPSRLPFGGKVPPFGTTYGIGERIRAVAEDYARGFGLGPHGHSPDNDRHPFNTLGNEEKRVQSLGFGNALVRLFEEKLGTRDVHAWALEECGNGPAEANVKHLLLSVQEWRTKGRNPSPLLADVLGRYLKEELETFNAGLPTGVPRLAIGGSGSGSGSGAPGAAASTSDGNIWSDVDRHQYGYDYVAHHQRSGEGTEAYLTSLIQRATLGGVQGDASNAGGDANFSSHLQQQAAQNFQVELAKIVGRGIPAGLIPERPAGRNSERSSGNVVPHVHSQELSRLLQRLRVTTEDISVVMRGLANCPEHIPINTNSTGSSSSNSSSPRHAFCVPVAFLLTWAGPSSPSTSTAAKRRGGGSSGANSNTSSSFIPRGRTGGNGANKDKMLVQVLDELTRIDDGYAMDVRYTIRQNRQNPILRQEFFTAFSPVLKEPALVAQRYEEYCEGKFVPNLTVAMEVFLRFLATISTNPEKLSPGGAADYFEVGTTGRATGQYTALKLLPPTIGPFRFENTLVENIATTNLFQRYGILAGPTVVQPTAFIAPSSSSIGYHLNRREDVVQLTMRNAQLLTTALEQSAYRKDIHANPALRFLLQSKTSAGLVATFNRYFQRVAPMLNYFQEVLQHHASQAGNRQFEASNANAALGRALEGERSPTIEAEFRRNSERYWRNVLDGRHGEDARGGAMMHSGGQRSYTQRGQGSGNASSSARRGDATPSAEVNLQKALGGGPHGSSSSAAPTGGAARRSSSARSSKERLGDVLRSVGERKPTTPSGPKKG